MPISRVRWNSPYDTAPSDTNQGEHQRQRPHERCRCHIEPLSRQGDSQTLIHCPDVEDGNVRRHFDAAFEVGAALHRHELIARAATRHALTADAVEAARWARIAIRATEAKTRLLQDVNLVNRTIGTLILDDGKRTDRIPSGSELADRFRDVIVADAEIVSEAETAWMYGDQAASEAAARAATDSAREDDSDRSV